ncbi:copper amine oxidase N-terminal domain-containing protein [Aminipila butyrica]|uniref:Copper amine oxidase N-terminal domain-containing protein n=1 Tax=Aminipila butyrica TaxID=433296 RepID=A0A858BSX0_9FIRM|nr:copper amine oxidase N-terminal domain-containing protein [Aminipila butyrica]QIB69003.1 copper amine oxidase N-terminal domain-containing protein [Aminipila butyrica]
MRKKIAVILCMVLGATTFFGCSAAEIGYLSMNKEISTLASCEFSGATEIYYDADAIKGFLTQVEGSEAFLTDAQEELDKFTGQKTIQVNFEGRQQLLEKDLRYEINLKAKLDGREWDLGRLYMDSTKGIYVERDMLIKLYLMSKELLPEYKDSYFYSAAYEKDLRNALGTSEYVEVVNAEGTMGYLTGGIYGDSVYASEELLNMVFNSLENIFKGYTSGAVSSVQGGYSLSLSGEQLIPMTSSCLDYISSNLDSVVDGFYKLMMDVEKWSGEESETWKQPMSKEERTELASQLSATKGQLDYLYKSGQLDLIKPLKLTETVKKSGNTYTTEKNLSMTYQGKSLFYIKSQGSLMKKDVNISIPAVGTPVVEISQRLDQLEASYNPVVAAKISWVKSRGSAAEYGDDYDEYWDDYNYCDIYYTRALRSPLSSEEEYDWLEYKNINKELYVPLRAIGEALGQEIGWDNGSQTAYGVQAGKRIDLNGVLDADTVYVKVREFEKLGYQVQYDGSNPEIHVVNIKKI